MTRTDFDRSILSGMRGSHAHGTTIDPDDDKEFGTDDVDHMDIVVLPAGFYLGLETYGYGRGTKETKAGPLDIVAYEMRKFMHLCLTGNPNALNLLWLDEYEHSTPAGRRLVHEREHLTLTKKTIKAHIGYAKDQYDSIGISPTNKAYMGEKRRRLAERFGYDVKKASHGVRLLRMLVELLKTGVVNVDRSNIDAAELVSIKRGEWSLAEVRDEFVALLGEARKLEERCTWPDEISREYASRLCVHVIDKEWRDRGGSGAPPE